ncbi:MAG: ATP-binding protein, partial [Gammaproteobacteria bacterium]
GIDEKHLAHLTERFYRIDKARSRERGGTGLGLAITRHVVQRHGGEVKIVSNVGEGTTFTLEFPLERAVELSVTDD